MKQRWPAREIVAILRTGQHPPDCDCPGTPERPAMFNGIEVWGAKCIDRAVAEWKRLPRSSGGDA